MSEMLTEEEYADLAEEYEKYPPKLSGKPGFFTKSREAELVNQLLEPDFARVVNSNAWATGQSQREIIQKAIKAAML